MFEQNLFLDRNIQIQSLWKVNLKGDKTLYFYPEIKFYVGLQVCKMKFGIFISQTKYIKEILKTFAMEDSRLVSTPMSIGHKLSKSDGSIDVN